MGILDIFRRNNQTAKVAKERLQIIVAHQRNGRESARNDQPAFMEEMKREILDVVRKYVRISPEDIEASVGKDGEMDVLALNINLSEREKTSAAEVVSPSSVDEH